MGGGCRTPVEAKVKAVLDSPIPKTKIDIRKILGTIGDKIRFKIYKELFDVNRTAHEGVERKK